MVPTSAYTTTCCRRVRLSGGKRLREMMAASPLNDYPFQEFNLNALTDTLEVVCRLRLNYTHTLILSTNLNIPSNSVCRQPLHLTALQAVRIKVIDKQPKQQSKTKVSYQRMVFSHIQGTKLTATLFGLDIDVYDGILTRGKIYDIKNMFIKEVPPRFANYEGEKKLYFTNSMSVMEVEDEGESSHVVSPHSFIKDISIDSSTDDCFDMILLVLHIHPEKLVAKGPALLPVREISVSDTSSDDILLVYAWNRRMIDMFDKIKLVLLEDPVVEISGLKISRFSGFSLATSLSTKVKLRPSCVEATVLREW